MPSVRVQILVKYNPKSLLLEIGVIQIECSFDPMFKKLKVYWSVHIALLSHKKQRFKTNYKRFPNPLFNQAFQVKGVKKSVVNDMSVRYRVYGRLSWAGKKRLAGEMKVDLACLMLQPDNFLLEWRTLVTGV